MTGVARKIFGCAHVGGVQQTSNTPGSRHVHGGMMRTEESRKETVMTAAPDELMNFPRCSSYQQLLITVAWMLRFVRNARNHQERTVQEASRNITDEIVVPRLEVQEIEEAERRVLRRAQHLHFPDEYNLLLENCKKPDSTRRLRKGSSLEKLRTTMSIEEMTIRVTGKLEEAFDKQLSRFPILIPYKGRLAELNIWDTHRKVFHSGVRGTLAALRERFYIIKG